MVEAQEPLYICPTSDFKFKLSLIKKNDDGITFEDTPTPSKQYKWSLRDNNFGQIQDSGLFQSKDKIGRADIDVVDQKFPNNTADAEVNIVEPHSLSLYIEDVTDRAE